jgi:hypothetical protein
MVWKIGCNDFFFFAGPVIFLLKDIATQACVMG